MKIDNELICNMCQCSMTHYEHKGTHIWICDGGGKDEEVGCANIQFEYVVEGDLINLQKFISDRQKTNSRNIESSRVLKEYER